MLGLGGARELLFAIAGQDLLYNPYPRFTGVAFASEDEATGYHRAASS